VTTVRLRTIRTVDELIALRRRRARYGVRGVALPLVADPRRRARLEARINRDLASCGCETGAVFVAAGLIVMVVAALDGSVSLDWRGIGHAIGVLLALGLIGKVVGLLVAELRLRATLRAVLDSAPGRA
jgi:ABC-type transporter Mla maintaining outer membrane lipid asymmetry permease subunit MlaE